MSTKLNILFISLLIAFIAFLSYNNNFFLVTSDKLFLEHQLGSEQYVLDGILHGVDSNGYLRLGTYTRPEIVGAPDLLSHQLYTDMNKDGEFHEYKSQFGLQLHVFNFLAENFDSNIHFLQSFSALLMSFTVALFFIAISREFSLTYGFLFCVPLIFSPWVVIFARNLYWVEATWFLPTVITFFFGKNSLRSIYGTVKMGGMLFVAFLIKCLCGYEYLTTIALSACAPLVYYTMQYRFGVKCGLFQLMICGISLFLAFLIAFGLHVRLLSTHSDNPFNDIVLIAKKRISTQNPTSFELNEWCKGSHNPECQSVIKKSLTSNRFIVTAKYFDIPHFLPWIDRADLSSTDRSALKAVLQGVLDKPTLDSIQVAISRISFQNMFLLVATRVASPIAFVLFNLFVFKQALKRHDSLSLGLLVSIMAPLSWFLLGKGHSYIHYHLNYVLWYLPYIPFAMLLLPHKATIKTDEVQ